MLNILPDVALNDYGIFMGDSGKDDALKQQVQQMSQAALQSGTITLLDALKVLKADTMTEAQAVLEQGIEAMKGQQEQLQAQQQQMQQAQAQADDAKMQSEMKLKQMEIDGRIKVAEINAEARIVAQEVASDANRDMDDVREKNKIVLEKVKADMGAQQKEKEMEHSKEIEAKKNKIKK